ncbi:HAD family hydrolase [Paenactinomyces guangxiensis]|uniref:HAD family hydrolase n=1 Tax=Paenactinomyces guangxiensis TaxID=1490290 RepID=A0A7W1WU02_9BACL|nr:HAD family hydrolase [Paenactinomyces guangxiensis]MBA4495851.1 HAD family hydrolase [Paenactinomyces guangxiensis]MBH8593012.1 HAD family hydrolase [Paenactinomyces guangxiensis]
MKAIIFDLDGTLFQTEKVAVPAFQETFRYLKEKGRYSGPAPSVMEIQSVFGLTHDEIWQKLMPGADPLTKAEADRIMLEKELELLEQGKGELFPEVEETLRKLQRAGWGLFIASNGVGPYVRGALESKGIIDLFQDIYTAGDHETKSKVDLVRICKQNAGITEGYMVGDRSSDVKAGRENNLTVIGCRYAGFPRFGEEDELAVADYKIEAFKDLLTIISV